MAPGSYLDNVRRVLGEEVMKVMTESSDEEAFPSEKLPYFALHLCEKKLVFGEHSRRKQCGDKQGAVELKAILCDWWNEELFEMTTDAALERLVNVLEHPDVNVKPLAAKIKKERDQPGKNQGSLSAGKRTPLTQSLPTNNIHKFCGAIPTS